MTKQEKRSASKRRWRQRNKAVMDLHNCRNKYAYRLCVNWVRENRPDIFTQCKKEAKQRWPISDLTMEAEIAQ